MYAIDPNQPVYDPSVVMLQPGFVPVNQVLMTEPIPMKTKIKQPKMKSSRAGIPSLHLPAIVLLAFSWLLHTLATFIPYWSTYSGISDSRAGLWSAQNFDYYSIQNFYFPEAYSYATVTDSVRFATSHTKGYLITVQFLMTFNFVIIFILLVFLVVDFILSQSPSGATRSFLIRDYNTSDTSLKYGLLLYILYILTVFEFASWITYVASRHDNNWKMHVSFAFTVIVSVFLIFVFVMYVIEFFKTFKNNRLKWEYWYGPYIEWAFFVHLTALLLLLTVICCPEWGYTKISSLNVFGEIGLFKQCYLSAIYKKSLSSELCTLSDTRSNQAWVNATQAFMLMAYIFGMIILFVIVLLRKEFRHNEQGYYANRVSQPKFTFIIAGLILFFCFIFSLIGIAIFGGEVYHNSITVNWAYIVAVFAMVLFLVAGILFILDGVHSQKQASINNSSGFRRLVFPAPLNYRVLAMQAPPKPQPALPPMQAMPPANFDNTPLFPPQQMMMIPPNYGMESYPFTPLTQAALANYFRQMENNPQLSPFSDNQGLMNYSGGNPLSLLNRQNDILNNNNENMTDLLRQHFIQQQRLNYNHERLLERYSRLPTPRISQFSTFGRSSLPGRNYDRYLERMRDHDDSLQGNSLAAWSRANVGTSDEIYRVMGGDFNEPLPRDVSSVLQHSRNEPMPFVRAEKFEPIKMYDHPVFGPTPAYVRPLFGKRKYSQTSSSDEKKNNIELENIDYEEKNKSSILTTNNKNDDELYDDIPLGYLPYQDWKNKNKHLIPVNPFLFNIYTQRSNGSIQSYGQSLYVPTARYNHNRRKHRYEQIPFPSSSDTDSTVDNLPDKASSSSKNRYYKIDYQTTLKNMSHPSSAEKIRDVSEKETSPHDPPSTTHSSRNNSNTLISSISSTSHSIPLVSAKAPMTDPSSTMNSTKLVSSSISNKKPESVSSTTVVPYQTLSSIYNGDTTTTAPLLDSKQLSSNQIKIASVNKMTTLSPEDNLNSTDSDTDEDDDEKKKTNRQEKKKIADNS